MNSIQKCAQISLIIFFKKNIHLCLCTVHFRAKLYIPELERDKEKKFSGKWFTVNMTTELELME